MRYIAVEGLNGVGKTTMVSSICIHGVNTFRDPDPSFRIRPLIEKLDMDLDEDRLAILYTAGSIFSQGLNLKLNSVNVSDRSPISTYACYFRLGFERLDTISSSVMLPDTVIMIQADERELIKRLQMRENSQSAVDHQLRENERMRDGYSATLSRFPSIKMRAIDVTNSSPGDARKLLEQAIIDELH